MASQSPATPPTAATPAAEAAAPAAAAATAAPAAGAEGAANQNQYHSASLYVGDLHPEVTEALLFDIFNAVGPVASIRVCRDAVTRRSLGYAYVNFHAQTDAERALDTMNYTPIKGRPCRMMWSQRDPSLRKTGAGNVFVKNLDLSIDNKALYDTFSLFGNILSCKVVTDKAGKSRGYGFVHFETVEAAEEAIVKINGMVIAGKEVFVGQFVKRNERPGNDNWTNVYVKNLPLSWGEDELNKLFDQCGPIASTAIMQDNNTGKSRGFGFVDFVEHESAVKCIEMYNDYEITIEGEAEPEAAKKDEKTEDADAEKPEGEAAEEATKEAAPKERTVKLQVNRAQKKVERERELQQKFEQLRVERLNKYQGVNLYVRNLHEDVDDDILRKEFSPFGSITSARVMCDQVTNEDGKKVAGPSKGFGFVCFSTTEEATKAVTEMNGKMILNKPIYVALAQRKDARRAQLEAQHQQRMPRGMPMQPALYPAAPMFYAQGGMPPQGRPNFAYVPQMMPRGMVPQQGFPRGFPMQPQPGFPMQPGMAAGQPGAGRGGPNAPRRGGRNQNAAPARGPAGRVQQQMPGNNFNNQKGAPAAAVSQEPPALTAQMLANASSEQQKNMIGERLYPLIQAAQPELAGKITGMLLEMDNPELLHLLESKQALTSKINEAMQVLEAHQTGAQ